jgi:LysR family transcriptional regulator, glycine cleavage system transcriptional activator
MGDHLRRGLLLEVGPLVTTPSRGYVLQWPPALTRDPGLQRLRGWLRRAVSSQESEDPHR